MNSKYSHLKLSRIHGEFKFVGFSTVEKFRAAIETVVKNEVKYLFIFKSPGDLSMVIPEGIELLADREEKGWVALTTVGAMPFGTVEGLIATISGALKSRGIGLCVVSSYDSDLFLIRSSKFQEAENILRGEGWEFAGQLQG